MEVLQRPAQFTGNQESGLHSLETGGFALTFEEALFTIAPSALFLALAPFYIRNYSRLPAVASAKEPSVSVKLGAFGLLMALQISSAVFYVPEYGSTSIFVTSAVISCLCVPALAVFMHLEPRARERSRLPRVYLWTTLLLDVTKAMSYSIRGDAGNYSAGFLMATIAATKALLLVLTKPSHGDEWKRDRLQQQPTPPKASIWDNPILSYINSNLLVGFQNFPTVDDLPNLDGSFASARLAAKFEPLWAKNKTSSHALMRATFWSQRWSLLVLAPVRLLFAALTFIEPFLLRSILREIGKPYDDTGALSRLIGAIALLHLALTVTRSCSKNMTNRVITKTRGILVSQILRKSFLLGPHEAKRSGAEGLMSSEVPGSGLVFPLALEICSSILEIFCGVYTLSRIVSRSSLLVFLPACAAWSIFFSVQQRVTAATESWNKSIAKRVSITSKLFSRLRGIKMIAAETAVGDYIQLLRRDEIEAFKSVRTITRWNTVALTTTYASCPIVVIAGALFWDGFENGFNAPDACAVVALSYLSARPLAAIINSSRRLRSSIPCYERVERFLLLEERVDSRDIAFVSGQKSLPHDAERFPIQLINATIVSGDGTASLTVDTAFEISTTTMVIGPDMMAKSTLLRSILGEAKVTHGSIYVKPQQVAYCDREEWICNITIRENIIGPNAYEEDWYNTVVAACLLQDINEFPLGDLTLAGVRGSNLSGGQRQRVALARAAYIRAGIVVLDDPLSALDRQSSNTVLKNLLGAGGLLKTLGTTVILSTQSVELLKSADRVLAIHTDGTVAIKSPHNAIKRYEGRGFLDDFEDDSEDISDGGSRDDSPTRHYTPPVQREEVNTQLFRYEDSSRYKYYFKSISAFLLISFLFVSSLVVLTERGPDIYLHAWLDRQPERKSMFLGYAVFGGSTMLLNAVWTFLFYRFLVPQSAEHFHRTLITSLTNATLSFLTYTDSEELLNRFSKDMWLIIQDVPFSFFYSVYGMLGVTVILVSIALSVQNGTALIAFVLLALLIVRVYYLRVSRQLLQLETEANCPVHTHLTECSEGIYHIRAFQWERQYLSRGLELLDQSQKPFYHQFCIKDWAWLVFDIITTAIGAVLVALAMRSGSTNEAALGLGLLKIQQIPSFMRNFVDHWVNFDIALDVVSRIHKFEKETPQEGVDAGADGTSDLPENWPYRGDIELHNVNADHTIDGADYRALHEISVEISAGAKVALVGRAGSGRSPFLLTILNLLKFTGTITIDGIDTRMIPRQVLRSRITTISQDLLDMPGSVRDNLVPQEIMELRENRDGDERLLGALEKVGLRKKVERCGGLDTPIEDVGLSSGEQQLLALARALLHHSKKNGKVIFIEEAMHYIDYECEEKLREVTEEAFQDCTVLTVAHRHHTLQSATNFLELSEGQLVSYE